MDQPFVGMLAAFGFNFAPRNWGLCYGGIVAISQNQSLFSLIGTAYGGDGRVNFYLPDLRGRAAVGWGQSPGLSAYTLGQKVGSETHQMTLGEMPNHTHDATFTPVGGSPAVLAASQTQGTKSKPDGGDYIGSGPPLGAAEPLYVPSTSAGVTVPLGGVSGGGGTGTVTVSSTGANSQFWLLQPFQVINWSICLSGLYPPRN